MQLYIYPTCLDIYTYMYVCTVQDAFLSQLSSMAPHMVPQATYTTLQCPCTLHRPNYNKLNTYHCVTGAALILQGH